jgi:putative nucleotidyltransferase with HDIG domain
MQGVEQTEPHISDVWTHTLEVVNRLHTLLDLFCSRNPSEDASNLYLGLAVLQLGKFRELLEQHLDTRLNIDRPFQPLFLMAALYHDVGKPETRQLEAGKTHFYRHDQEGAEIIVERARALRLSKAEMDRVYLIVRNHMRPGLLAGTGQLPTRRAIYRFFRDTGPAGVDICLLSLADVMATYGHTLPIDVWNRQLEVVKSLLEAWWERPQEEVSPPTILNGNEIMAEFKLSPGPLIGELLAAIREAQAAGEISTRAEALALVNHLLDTGK